MQIQKVKRMEGVGIFRDFRWPNDLPEFHRYNLIYGWNGTGKTTISRAFQNLGTASKDGDGEVTVTVEGRDTRSVDFPDASRTVRVFNRAFVEENIFEAEGVNIPLILILGQASGAMQERLEDAGVELAEAVPDAERAKADVAAANRALNRHCVAEARRIKELLRSEESSTYNNYDKGDYRSRAAEHRSLLHTRDGSDVEKLQLVLTTRSRDDLQTIVYVPPDITDEATDISSLLSTTVTHRAIEALARDTKLAEWVGDGLVLHRERERERCPYCEQPMPLQRWLDLEQHFNDEFDRLKVDVNDRVATLRRYVSAVERVSLPDRARLHEHLAADWDQATSAFQQSADTLVLALDGYIRCLETKSNAPFRSDWDTVIAPVLDWRCIERLNSLIAQHNRTNRHAGQERRAARESLELHYVSESLIDFMQLENELNDATQRHATAEQRGMVLAAEVEGLAREIQEHRIPAEEFNDELRSYLGHDELRLAVNSTGYAVQRNGVPATNLSEGERTAFALLFFLKTLKDYRFDAEHGIVVLDDPVSSLDATRLYSAFSFIRERTQDTGQLFVFTHNWSLFRLVKGWFGNVNRQAMRSRQSQPSCFYMLRTVTEKGHRSARIGELDPLLARFDTEYQYLFKLVREAAELGDDASLADHHGMPNVARRLLEGFLAFRYPGEADRLAARLARVKADPEVKRRIERFLNVESHGSNLLETGGQLDGLAEAPSVMRSVLRLIEVEDERHYAEMVKLVNRS